MNFPRGIWIVSLLSLGQAAFSRDPRDNHQRLTGRAPTPGLVKVDPCPKNTQELKKMLTRHSRRISDQVFKEPKWWGDYETWSRYSTWLDSCKSELDRYDKNKCTDNFARYVKQKLKMTSAGHSMGFAVSNAQYHDNTPKAALALPIELQKGLPKNWREIANRNGWKYLEYFSASVGFYNPEEKDVSVFRRLAIYVPDDRGYQKWIQFVPPETQKDNIENVYHADVIAVDTDKDGYLRQHHTQWERTKLDQTFESKPSDTCISCHANGPRVIRPWPGHPTEGNVTPKQMADLQRAAQNSNWGQAVDMSAMGPPIGKRQGCTDCHANRLEEPESSSAGFLHDMTNQYLLREKMVGTLQMPPDRLDNYKELKEAVSLLDQLTNEQQALIKGPPGKVLSYAELFENLHKAKLFDAEKYKVIQEQLELATNEAIKDYDELVREQREDLHVWLSKNSVPACKFDPSAKDL